MNYKSHCFSNHLCITYILINGRILLAVVDCKTYVRHKCIHIGELEKIF